MKQFQVQLNEAQADLLAKALKISMEAGRDQFTARQIKELKFLAGVFDDPVFGLLNILDTCELTGDTFKG